MNLGIQSHPPNSFVEDISILWLETNFYASAFSLKTYRPFFSLILLLLAVTHSGDRYSRWASAGIDEGSGNAVADKSRQGNDAKVAGNAKWIDGKIGGEFQFDGKTWVVAPHIPCTDKAFTIQFWVKSDMLSGAEEVIFSQHELNPKAWAYTFVSTAQ